MSTFEYKKQTFGDKDITLIKALLDKNRLLDRPRLSQLGIPDWWPSFQKLRDVGAFDNFNELKTGQSYDIDIYNWQLNHPIIEKLLDLHVNPPAAPASAVQKEDDTKLDKAIKWFKNKKWFVAIALVIIGISILASFANDISDLLDWFGVNSEEAPEGK